MDLPLREFRRTDSLLAFHVEPILVAISLLYRLWSSPLLLLGLQAVGLALGSWPAFLLARQQLRSEWAGLAFALAYLMAPAVQGAALSDFHTVSLGASLLMTSFYAAQTRQRGLFLLSATLALLCREDMGLLVGALGLYSALVLKDRNTGVLVFLAGCGWFLLCAWVILPHFNGLSSSPFLDRLNVFGPTLRESILGAARQPTLVWRWVTRPEVVRYVTSVLASTGFAALAAPAVLALAVPVLVTNIFSTWAWTYSGGDHYSIALVPFVIAAAIMGSSVLIHAVKARLRWRPSLARAVVLVVILTISAFNHYWWGVSPVSRTFHIPAVSVHHESVRGMLSQIPPDAPVSAQSNLYPHLSQRERAYWFPAVNDAQFIALDVTTPSFPLTDYQLYREATRLLDSGRFHVKDAQDGCLLLERGAGPTELPEQFYTFVLKGRPPKSHIPAPHLEGRLEFVGSVTTMLPIVHVTELPGRLATFWRVLEPMSEPLRFVFMFTRSDGAVVLSCDWEVASTAWYPTTLWRPGELIQVDTPILGFGRLKDVLVGVRVVNPATGVLGRFLTVTGAPGAFSTAQDGTLLRIRSLR